MFKIKLLVVVFVTCKLFLKSVCVVDQGPVKILLTSELNPIE